MIIPAFSFFSVVSQEAANQLALDSCAGGCALDFDAIEWFTNDNPGTGTGTVSSSALGPVVTLQGNFCTDPGCCAASTGAASASLPYAGSETTCNLNISITNASGVNTISAVISVDGVDVLNYSVSNVIADTVVDIPFTVPVPVVTGVAFAFEIVLGVNDDGVQCGSATVVYTLGEVP